MRTFAEQLEYDYSTDDIKLRSLLQERMDVDDIGGLLDAVSKFYAGITGGEFQLRFWIDNVIADKVAELVREDDASMLASFDGEDPGR